MFGLDVLPQPGLVFGGPEAVEALPQLSYFAHSSGNVRLHFLVAFGVHHGALVVALLVPFVVAVLLAVAFHVGVGDHALVGRLVGRLGGGGLGLDDRRHLLDVVVVRRVGGLGGTGGGVSI